MAEPSRHTYWAHALQTMINEIEANGYLVSVVDDSGGIHVWSLDLTEKTRISLDSGEWEVDE